VSLRNHAGSPLPISGDGSFTFPGNVEPGQAYNVVVSQQPTTEPQFCAVANGSGTVGADNIANIAVTVRRQPVLHRWTGLGTTRR
jgi:hypothetical protein